ncbi:4'-phosphopantetheinyl transferase [Melanogaster broomeanus]|nr:4'-phosphopantetheinyl transferase [Melanogaster broomeanus]
MTIHGIGIDLLHVPRMVALIERRGPARLASRILSLSELQAFRHLRPDKLDENGQGAIRFLGVRWAVKEAAYKALYPFKLTWKDLTYTTLDIRTGSKPALVLHSGIDNVDIASSPLPRLHVSVSHDGEYIIAHVVAETLT